MLSNIAVLVVAALHLGFLVVEMFVWTKPSGLKIFRQTRADAETTKALPAAIALVLAVTAGS